jgi:signal transduction histidine kinase
VDEKFPIDGRTPPSIPVMCKGGAVQTPDGWRRPGPSPAQARQDRYIGLLVVAIGLLSVALSNVAGSHGFAHPPSWPEQIGWAVAVAAPLGWRRRWPEATLLVIAVAFIAAQIRGTADSVAASGALYAALFTLGAWGRDRKRATVIRLAVIGAMFAWLGVALWLAVRAEPPDSPVRQALAPLIAGLIMSVLFNAFFFGFAYLSGNTAWTSALRRHELEVQADELRRTQAVVAEQAVLHERVRIARELHDVVAHHVSVMGVQAGAARRVLEKDPGKARTALSAIEHTARTAVDELRRMLTVLRSAETDTTGPGQGIDRVEELLQAAREAGLTVRHGVYGDPVELPASTSLAAYRIVQEAVTNTIKHARAGSIDVRIRYLAQEVEVDVADDGVGSGPAANGLGLIGMRERVAAYAGTLEAGPRAGGGYQVRARFPVTAAVAA